MRAPSLTCLAFLVASSNAGAGPQEQEVATITSCGTMSIRLPPNAGIEEPLRDAICQYYNAQERHDWSSTFRQRPKLFQKFVDFAFYSRDMSERAPISKLTLLDVRSIRRVGLSQYQVIADFIRTKEGTLLEATDPSKRYASVNVDTDWEYEGEGWKCASCGEVQLFTLNERIVRP